MHQIFNPRQIALVTVKGRESVGISRDMREDIVTVGWHMPVSLNPLIYAISLGKKHFSTKLIQDSKMFAVNYLPETARDVAVFCSSNSGRDVDKFKSCGLSRYPCRNIDCSRLSIAVAYLECHVVSEIDVGDHILFIAKIVHSEQFSNQRRLFHIGDERYSTTLE